jgi:hypothetical protein
MYEVGSWFVYLLDGAILAVLAFIAIVMVFVKRGQYAKQAEKSIRAEIQLPTGWSEYHVVPCDDNAREIEVRDGDKSSGKYMLNPERRRYGKHPMNPFMGLSWLQVPIRIEAWAKDNPEPIKPSYEFIEVTEEQDGKQVTTKVPVINYDTDEDGNRVVANYLIASSREIKAVEDEHTAVATAMEIQEMHAQQTALISAIKNQPNKMVIYLGLGLNALLLIINLVYIVQIAGLM